VAADQRLWLHDEAAARRREVESVLQREHQLSVAQQERLGLLAPKTAEDVQSSASGVRRDTVRGGELALTRYCYYQYCMVYSVQTGGRKGSRILPNSRAIVLQQCGQCRWAWGMTGLTPWTHQDGDSIDPSIHIYLYPYPYRSIGVIYDCTSAWPIQDTVLFLGFLYTKQYYSLRTHPLFRYPTPPRHRPHYCAIWCSPLDPPWLQYIPHNNDNYNIV